MNYTQFRKDFESSGMTQKAYASRIGMSASMVHYYLGKTKTEPNTSSETKGIFNKINIEQAPEPAITITTPHGVQIVIPL